MTTSRSPRPSRRRAVALAVSAAAAAVTLACRAPSAGAQTWTGNGADSNWTTAANWSAAPANNGTAAIVFNGTNKLGPAVNTSYSINSLAFTTAAGAFSLSSGTGTVTGALTLGAGGITDSSANAETLALPITLAAPQTWLANAGALTVSGNVTNGGNLLTVDGPAITTLSGALSGTGGLTKTGTGSLTLTGTAANTFTGLTTVAAGTLTLNKSAGVPALSGNVTLTGGTLAISQSSSVGPESIITESGGTLNLPANPVIGGLIYHAGGLFWGGGPVTLSGTAANVLSVSGSFQTLTIPFNLTGATGGGITNLDSTAATLAGTINLGGTVRFVTVNDNAAADDLVISGAISNGALAKDGAGTLALTGTNTYTGVTLLDQGTLRVAADAALGATTSPLTFNGGTFQASTGFSTPRPVNVLANGGTVNVPSTPLTFAGTLSGSGALSKTGNGTLVIGGGSADAVADPYTGTLTVNAGTVNLNKAPNTPALSGDLVVNGGTVNITAAGQLSSSANVTLAAGAINFGPTNAMGSFTIAPNAAGLTINSGLPLILSSAGTALSVNFPGPGTLGIGVNLTGATGGSIAVTSTNGFTFPGPIDLGGVNRTINVSRGASSCDLLISGTIADGGFTKTGPGFLQLAATSPNTYTGLTNVNQGTLYLGDTGGVAVPGPLAVNFGATVTLLAPEQIAPASPITVAGGTLNLNGFAQTVQTPATLSGGTITGGTLNLAADLTAPSHSGQSVIASALNLAPGTHTLNVTQASLDPTNIRLTGVVSGTGGLLFTGAGGYGANVDFAGTASNTFTGGATIQTYVFLDNAPGTVVLPGPVTIGGGTNYGDVIIDTDNAIATSASVTVLPNGGIQTGTGHSQTVTTLYLDGNLDGNLVLAPGGTGTIGPDAFVDGISTVVNNGTLTLAGPDFDGKLLNDGTVIFAADLKLTGFGSFTNSGSFTLPLGRTLSAPNNGLINLGTATLAGGTLNGNYVENDNNLSGFGTITGYSFINTGYASVTGGTLNLAATINATSTGNIDVQPGGQLQLTNSLTNAGAITLFGSAVTSPSATGTLNNTGLVAGRGTISAPLANTGTLQPQGGSLNVTTPFTNNGVIQLTTGSSLLGAQITNAGTIQGAGTISNPISNSTGGTLEPTGGTLNLTAQLTNSATGLIRVGAGNKALLQNFPTNAGTISLTGGTLDTANHPLTNSGQLTGYGTLATGGLINNGAMTLTGGPTTVNGPLTNSPGQTIKVQYQPAIFTSPVTNNGTFTVLSTTATFAGGFAGSAPSDPSSLSLGAQNSAPGIPSLAGTLSIDPAGSVLANYVRQGTLTSSGSLAIRPTSLGGDTSVLNTLTLNPGSAFDLADAPLILITTPADTLRQYLLAHELFSSTAAADPQHRLALAYATASQLGTATWGGQPVTPTSLLAKLTYLGDANLDGTINADDYALLDRGFSTHGTTWTSGDFNYDGAVTPADYLLIDTTLATQQGGHLSPDFLSQRESQFGPAYVSQLLSNVPEPSALACLFAALPLLFRLRTNT